MNLLINLNTNNSDLFTFLLKNCIKSERKGKNLKIAFFCFLVLFLCYYYQNHSSATSTTRKLGPIQTLSLLSTAVLMFLDTADMPTQTISLSHDAKQGVGGNPSVTEYIKLAVQQLLQNACQQVKQNKIISSLIYKQRILSTTTGKAF